MTSNYNSVTGVITWVCQMTSKGSSLYLDFALYQWKTILVIQAVLLVVVLD